MRMNYRVAQGDDLREAANASPASDSCAIVSSKI
jgi:hypothetical protein